jgi:hypothetical protein
MTRFVRQFSKEKVMGQVMQCAHVRSLPTYETKNKLLDRLEAATDTAVKFQDARESCIEEAMKKVTFFRVSEKEFKKTL